MNTNLKNIIVSSGFLGCAIILTAIVSLGTNKEEDVKKSEIEHTLKTELLQQPASVIEQHTSK